jgi:threonine/homoserine/homoserine lactone efflux protein
MELYSFIIIVMLMIMTPGANQILVLQSGLVLGHKAAIYNVLGISASMFVHATITGLGISIIIMQSPGLYQAIKTIGAGYIAYLALASLYSAYRLRGKAVDEANGAVAKAPAAGESAVESFAKGFTSNVLNIHTSIVFLSIFPQYMNPEQGLFVQSLFLTLIFIGLLLCWYTLIIALVFKVRQYLVQPRIQMRIKAVTGSLLLIMSVRMLLRQ